MSNLPIRLFRNSLLRIPGFVSRCIRRQHTGAPPTYPPNNPIHIRPGVLQAQRSPLSSFLRWTVAGAFVGLPGYWILWLGQKVSIPYSTLPNSL